tara:strand:- start:932 stop:1543 length:612 start_codon:yes stop_codon:yes gene_type:complete
MSQMRTEFSISGAISMSDLYRGGSEVPSSSDAGGTVSTDTAAGSGSGSNENTNSWDDTNVHALPQTTASGDTISYSSITATATMGSEGIGFNKCYANWYLTNNGSASPPPVTSSLGGVSMGYGQGGAGTSSQSYSDSNASMATGLTHIVLRAHGGGGQFSDERTSMSSSMAGGTITLVQNRDVNTDVPASGTISFSDLYGAVA